MTHNVHNGWYNYETWVVNLWLSNDQDSCQYWRQRSKGIYRLAQSDSTFTKLEWAAFDLMDELKELFYDSATTLLRSAERECSVWDDLLGAALCEVNWHEIATHWIEEAAEALASH